MVLMAIVKEATRKAIEAKLATQGDYVKINYLSSCLQENLDFDTRKFVLTQLAKLYENKGMHAEAGKLMRNAADINTTFTAKISDFLESAKMFARAGKFDEADLSIARALASANSKEKAEIKSKQKLMYMAEADALLQRDKRRDALAAFEKLSVLDLTPTEKASVQNTLLSLYEKLGRVSEFMTLKKRLG